MNFKERLQKIKLFIFDMDGVLTNGTLLVTENELHRTMNIKDGYAMAHAIRNGYEMAIISGGHSSSAEQRFKKLGLKNVFMGVENKKDILMQLLKDLGLSYDNTLYMGDDMPDLPCMKLVSVPCAPYDACSEVLETACYVSPKRGGEGCVRDVIEQVLKLHGKWA
ncbi:MAG: hypothetical protein RIQ89_2232 [Bacteroidota bacterium]|jgi:3-deoxy-D-manno-octulosonate 8-phosphate phosphatase (KDO 8-P phosphatase)